MKQSRNDADGTALASRPSLLLKSLHNQGKVVAARAALAQHKPEPEPVSDDEMRLWMQLHLGVPLTTDDARAMTGIATGSRSAGLPSSLAAGVQNPTRNRKGDRMNETPCDGVLAAPAGQPAEAGYYRADYGRYAPDWIPQPGDVSPAAWDRYHASKPGSRKHGAADAAMHQEVSGRGFPGPDPDRSYWAGHGYQTVADRCSTPCGAEYGVEPADAWDAGREAG